MIVFITVVVAFLVVAYLIYLVCIFLVSFISSIAIVDFCRKARSNINVDSPRSRSRWRSLSRKILMFVSTCSKSKESRLIDLVFVLFVRNIVSFLFFASIERFFVLITRDSLTWRKASSSSILCTFFFDSFALDEDFKFLLLSTLRRRMTFKSSRLRLLTSLLSFVDFFSNYIVKVFLIATKLILRRAIEELWPLSKRQ